MFEKFFGKMKSFFKKSNLEKRRCNDSNKEQSCNNEQSDSTLGNVSGGQGSMPPGSHGLK